MRHAEYLLFAIALSSGSLLVGSAASGAESGESSGPCGGASAPSLQVLAHVVGKSAKSTTKVIAHFESDIVGRVTGELAVGRGVARVEATSWCRLWSGGKTEEESGVIHVLGTTTSADGVDMFLQVDIRSTDGGRIRVRTRRISGHSEEHSATDDSHGGWVSLTGEGWLRLTRLRVAESSLARD